MRALRWSAVVALLGILVFATAGAAEDAAGADAGLTGLPLLDLRGKLVPVRYSSGSLQRAAQVQEPFELLAAEFARGSGHEQRLKLMLLSRAEWEEAELAMPYGLPMRVLDATVALAAWGDSGSVALWRRLLSRELPAADDAPLRSTADEAASLVVNDLFGLFEGGRVLMDKAGFRGTERWITDVVAHTVAVSVAERAISGGLGQAKTVYAHLGELRAEAPLPLSGYRSGISLEDWLWYQSQFFAAAAMILDEERGSAAMLKLTGKSPARAVLKPFRKSGGRLSRADLVSRYSALNAWLEGSFAAEPAGD